MSRQEESEESLPVEIMQALSADSRVRVLCNSAGEPVGLDFSPGMTYEEWIEEWKVFGEKLNRLSRAIRWLVGDWLNFFLSEFGSRPGSRPYEEAAEIFGYSRGALYNMSRVCRVWPASLRDLSLPIMWYEDLAALATVDMNQAKALMHRAREEQWARARLIAETKGLPAPETDETETHARIESLLLGLGSQLGYDLWLAPGDGSKLQQSADLNEFSMLDALPQLAPGNHPAQKIINYIDVIWLQRGAYIAAFEVEKTSSIYSGILRLSDLATVLPNLKLELFLVAPEQRRHKVLEQLNRPTFKQDHVRLHQRCRLITFERLTAEVELLGDRVRNMKPMEFLSDISESCDLIEGTVPDDSQPSRQE